MRTALFGSPMTRLVAIGSLLSLGILAGCKSDPQVATKVTPVYSKETGQLEQLTADRDNDGKIDTRAYMDGAHLKFIELDRNNDSVPDRWEYYTPGVPSGSAATGAGSAFDKSTLLLRAEEANGPTTAITRREYYEKGVIVRVEEDTDFDGRIDKWEVYAGGALTRMDLDLQGRGKADRRLVYKGDGSLDHVEIDPTGTGSWAPAPTDAPATPESGRKPGAGKS